MPVSNSNLTRQMIDLYGRMNRLDKAMEANEQENVYPSKDTVSAEAKLGKDLAELSAAFGAAHPGSQQLTDAMQDDARYLSTSAGKLEGMYDQGTTYGSGWGATHNKAISDLSQAISERLTGPNADLAKQMLDLFARLERKDRAMEIYEEKGTIYPSYDFASSTSHDAADLSKVARELAKALPEQSALADKLNDDALLVARNAGKLDGMADHETTFGSNWGTTNNGVIEHLRQAMQLLIGSDPVASADAKRSV